MVKGRLGRMNEREKALAQMSWPSIQHLQIHIPARSADNLNAWRRTQGLKTLPDRYKMRTRKDAKPV